MKKTGNVVPFSVDQEPQELPVTLTRAKVTGLVKGVFWGLRLYIVVMLVLVIVGFARGSI